MGKQTDAYMDYLYAKRELDECLKLQLTLPDKIEKLQDEIRELEREYNFN